jgi:hypothetical protein
MGDKKLKAHIVTKNAASQFHLLPEDKPMDYFILFFNDELLNNIVIETNRYARYTISNLQLSLWSIWGRWSNVSVPDLKVFLGLIINWGLISLPDKKDYWCSERKTQIKFFGEVMPRDHFLQIFWMMLAGK